MHVCHKCDNPACVRPSHLFVATHAENMSDKDRKGRHGLTGPKNPSRGEQRHNAVLKATDIPKIRKLSAEGRLSQKQIGAMFGVSQTSVSDIIRGKIWAHVN